MGDTRDGGDGGGSRPVPVDRTMDETHLDALAEAIDRVELSRGATVHRYVIIDTLGAGASGVVYAAYDPELDRRVAVKVLHAVLDMGDAAREIDASTRERHRGRMLREAQALARLRHPNVVTVYDVGRLDERVFIAMEFVAGQTLSDWLATTPRSTPEILHAFAQAGRGLAAAHAHGLVHRDFKPDNAIVAEDGAVRVLDFGLARAVDDAEPGRAAARRELEASEARSPTRPEAPIPGELAEGHRSSASLDTNLTQDGVLVGTPAYMAPEQHMRLPASTASDQFSFAVALWEALYGVRPFAGVNLAELAANVIDGRLAPTSPQARVPPHVRRALERALCAEASARWPDMNALLDAIEDDPAPRRRRWLVGGAVALAIPAVVALVVSQPSGAERKDAACRAGADAMAETWPGEHRDAMAATFRASGLPYADAAFGRVDGHLQDYASSWRGSWADACAATHVRHEQSSALLDRRLACLRRERVALEATVAVLAAPTDDARGEAVARALDAVAALEPPARCDDVDRLLRGTSTDAEVPVASELDGALAEARALERTGDYVRARAAAEDLRRQAADAGAWRELARAHRLLASIASQEDEAELQVAHLREAYLAAERAVDDELRADLAVQLAIAFGVEPKQRALGEAWLERAQALAERTDLATQGEADLAFAEGRILLAAGELDPATERLEAAARLAEAAAPDRPLAGRTALSALATAYRERAKYPEALAIDDRLVALSRQHYGDDHPETAAAISNLGNTLHLSGDDEAAVPVFERALETVSRVFGEDSIVYANRLNNLAVALDGTGREEEALAAYRRALAIGEAKWGPKDKRVAPFLENLGTVYTQKGQYAEAHEVLERSHDIRVAVYGPDHPNTALNHLNFGWAKHKLGDHEAALELFRSGLAVWEDKLGADYADNGIFHNNIGDVLRAQGDCEAAVEHYERTIALFEPTYGEDYTELLYPLSGLGICEATLGRRDAARQHLDRALKVSEDGDYPAGYLAATHLALAKLLAPQDPETARTHLEQALKDAKNEPGQPQRPPIETLLATL